MPTASAAPELAPALATDTAAPPLPRVLLLGWEYAPRLTGGLGTASVRLAHALAERVELSVIVPRLPDEADDADAPELPLSALAAAADGPDVLRHFPESADWSAERPRRVLPTVAPNSTIFAETAGVPAAPRHTPALGRPVRLTALSEQTPASVRAATVAPRPPAYEVFARQVRRVALGVLPYAEAAEVGPEISTENIGVPSSEGLASSKNIGVPSFAGLTPSKNIGAPSFAGLTPGKNIEAPSSEVLAPSSFGEPMGSDPLERGSDPISRESEPEQPAANPEPSPLTPDPLTEALAPFRAPALNPLTLPSSNTEVVQFARLAARLASGDAVDVIYAHDWPTFLAGVEIRLEKRVPLVLHVHSTSFDRHGPPVHGWVFELERAAFRAADRVVAVSHYGAGVLRQHYGVDAARIHVVHHGFSAGPLGPQWEARPVSATPKVLFVGRLTSQKNPLGFVDIAQLVLAEVPNARFALAGDGPQRAAVQAAADAAGFDENQFELLGFLDDVAITAALVGAAVVCLPARSEPFGLAALEAAAAGVPLVLSTTTGAAEVLPGARTADFDDVAALATHVIELLRDEPARRRAVRENAAAARRLTWERAAEEVLGVLVG